MGLPFADYFDREANDNTAGEGGISENLQVEQSTHSWAFELGSLLGCYFLLCNDFDEKSIPDANSARHAAVQSINKTLASHRISYNISEVYHHEDPQTRHISKTLLHSVYHVTSPSHCAFVVLGSATYILNTYGSLPFATSRSAAELKSFAIRSLSWICDANNVYLESLFERLINVDDNAASVLHLVHDLQEMLSIQIERHNVASSVALLVQCRPAALSVHTAV